ncbi:TNF receptor-associated factor 2-like isoform X2 [Hydractinia symbiolongicarpus]|uniref:TNF receptor-associated factor 2-like isoform X2 n=1 Tax=Hydractinia symbiolongicarpus TaxID=13093 RepID=UPI00254FA37D|nr:TNF receptor-associated factor 2-like isoform X2 [Hydractinia symbiolongicarpus]
MSLNSKYNQEEGFSVKLQLDLSQQVKYICLLCKKVLKNPVQTIRGLLACESCYYRNFSANGGINCPLDGEPIAREEIFKDNGRAREIRNLICACPYRNDGCDWTDIVGKFEEHQYNCNFLPVACIACGRPVGNSQYVQHLQSRCDKIDTLTECVYAIDGCKYKPITKDDHIKHLHENTLKHASLRLSNQQKSQYSFAAFQQVAEEVLQQQAQINSMMNLVSSLHNQLHEARADEKILLKKVQNMQANIPQVSASNSSSLDQERLKEIKNLQSTIAILNKNISDFDLRQQLLENTNYKGRILWKIDQLQQRMQLALIGRVTALHSAPAFTQKYGYKFCGRVYLNGDGIGKCSHVSLFFILMKSEYDNLLEWPFQHTVTFTLINQQDEKKNVLESFATDVASSSFQKPTREMNIAAGCPLFIQRDHLLNGGFVKDDCIFVEINVQ